MAALQCEICGGKLMAKAGGLFECEYCGMEYNTDWAKAKIQEIKGTVKVEGTVEVKGTVKVDGPVKVEGAASKENLLQRGRMALEDGQWDTAESCYNKILDMDPQCAEAYLGLAIQKRKYRKREDHIQFVTNPPPRWLPIQEHHEYWQAADLFRRAESLAEGSLREYLESVHKEGEAQLEAQRQAETKVKSAAEEEQRKKEEEQRKKLEERRRRCVLAQNMISVGTDFAVGLKADGTVMISGKDADRYDVSEWTDIVAVGAGRCHIVGLRSNGTMVVVGSNGFEQCNVSDWTDIAAISAGHYHTVGLKSDGTVIAVGSNSDGECEVAEWTDIVEVSAGYSHTVGLRSDGTVVAVGSNGSGQCNVSDWKDIAAVSAGGCKTAGLKADGTVVVSEKTKEMAFSCWENVVAIAVCDDHVFGVFSNGQVRYDSFRYRNMSCTELWKTYLSCSDIVAIAAQDCRTVGLKASGKVVEHCEIGQQPFGVTHRWKLFQSLDTIEQEWEEARQRAKAEAERQAREKEERRRNLDAERSTLQTELAGLKGLFTALRRKQIETRLAVIETELKGLS